MKSSHPRTELLLVFIGLLLVPPLLSAYGEADAILQAAEGVFKTMKEQRFEELWSLLTAKSRRTIVNDIFKATSGSGGVPSKDQISNDMDKGGPTAQAYWRAFLQNFDPDTALEQSKWELGPIKKDSAEIILQHKQSQNPATIKLLRENGSWKMGLVETFWVGK